MKRLGDTWNGSAAMRDLPAAETTVAVMRRLAGVLPWFHWNLTNALRHLATVLIKYDRSEEALAAAEESVRICRQRVTARPGRYGSRLAWSLVVQARALLCLGRWEQALAAAEESAALCWQMKSTAPATFGPALFSALRICASSLNELGRMQEAVTNGEQVLRFARRLAARRSGREADLAFALYEVGVYLGGANRLTDELRAYDEVIPLLQLPGADQDLLARASNNREICLRELEQAGMVVLGPYPLCPRCEQTNGGLVAVRHPQRHIRANGRQACVDQAMADIITTLWKANCDTRSCCEDDEGNASVILATGHASKAMDILAGIGIQARNDNGELYFPLPG